MKTNDKIHIAIAATLAAHGFVLTEGPAVAAKEYATAVGPRQAIIWLSPVREGAVHRTLSGDYQSEGRNILASSLQLIPVDADEAAATRLALRFIADAEQEVGQSYAVSLLRSRMEGGVSEVSGG